MPASRVLPRTRQLSKTERSIQLRWVLAKQATRLTITWMPLVLASHATDSMAMSSAAKRLHGKTILITGASSGIGRSTAFEFARTAGGDLKLVLAARRIETLQEISSAIRKEVGEGVEVWPAQLDVSNPKDVGDFVENLPEKFRNIDVLINNAYERLALDPPCKDNRPAN